eukprot:scaffold13469_cov45-Prasinocladus_malaysianus.AAC.3
MISEEALLSEKNDELILWGIYRTVPYRINYEPSLTQQGDEPAISTRKAWLGSHGNPSDARIALKRPLEVFSNQELQVVLTRCFGAFRCGGMADTGQESSSDDDLWTYGAPAEDTQEDTLEDDTAAPQQQDDDDLDVYLPHHKRAKLAVERGRAVKPCDDDEVVALACLEGCSTRQRPQFS